LKINHDLARIARHIFNFDAITKIAIDLVQQWQWVVVIAEAHCFAFLQGGLCAKYRGMPEPARHAACIKCIDAVCHHRL
jgi:hypothetical protein